MTTDLAQSRSQTKNRFGQLSKNMFFARHVAQPRYLKFITGASGQRVCHVREEPLRLPFNSPGDVAKSLISDARFNIAFPPNSYNEALLRSYSHRIQPKKRRERLLPPLPGWNPTGTVVEDTDNWRRELSRIAEMVGLVTVDELTELERKNEIPVIPMSPVVKTSITSGQYSRQSGRWNETPKSANRCRSARRRTPLTSIVPNHLFCVDEQEREMWMLQVLCQILQTESLNEIQSWLVSSGPSEKDAVGQLISTAIKGLEENGRIQPAAYFNGNTKGIQVNMDTFGSLLANRFPHVSSSSTPSFNQNSSKPMSRPRTAPQIQTHERSKTEFNSKSSGQFQPNLGRIAETTERISIHSKTPVPQPTTVDNKRDVQILTLNDAETNPEQVTNKEKEATPF